MQKEATPSLLEGATSFCLNLSAVLPLHHHHDDVSEVPG
jgi:hypothetical protein